MNDRSDIVINENWHIVLSCPFCRVPVISVPSDEGWELLKEALTAWPNMVALSYENPHARKDEPISCQEKHEE